MSLEKIKKIIIDAKSKPEVLKQQNEIEKAKQTLATICYLNEVQAKSLFDFLANDDDCKCNQKVVWQLSAKENAAIHLIEIFRSKLKEFDIKEKKKLRDAKFREKLPSVSVRLYGKLIAKERSGSDGDKDKNSYHRIPDDNQVFGKDKNNRDRCFKELASEAFNSIAKDYDAVCLLIDINKLVIDSGSSYSKLFMSLKNHLEKK